MRIPLDIPLTFSEIKLATGASVNYKENKTVYAITTNSIEVLPGDLFIALKGENSNGENYINSARNNGAYIVSASDNTAEFHVKDTESSLLSIAAFYKTKLTNLKYTIAVTGSVGKTTTKNILTRLLQKNYKVSSTKENFNNSIGVSYTLLSAKLDDEILVVELGMNHIGEISVLSRAVKPNGAIITNIGTSHIGNLGSRELIAKAKLEILDGMDNEKLVIPFEEKLLNINSSFYTFSTYSKDADCFIKAIDSNSTSSTFDLISKSFKLNNQSVPLPGGHVLSAIAASISIIDALNLSFSGISEEISKLSRDNLRGKFINYKSFKVYDDSYSSSYESVISDFELLSLYPSSSKSCVLGDMLELGGETERLHRRVGEMAYKYGFQRLYAFGVYSTFIAMGASDAGMPQENIFLNDDITSPEITAKQILDNHTENEIILIKASHKVHAERIPKILSELSLV